MTEDKHLFMPKDHMDELYNAKNFLVRFAHNNRLDNILKILSAISPDVKKNILDAGCGEGHLLKKMHDSFEENAYYGMDITPLAINDAKNRCPFANIKVGNIGASGYPADFFDIIVCAEVLEHIYDFQKVLKELNRILKPGGALIITFPNEILWTVARFFLGRRPIKVQDHVNSFSRKSMKKFVNMKSVSETGLPFRLPFFISLGYLIAFKKDSGA